MSTNINNILSAITTETTATELAAILAKAREAAKEATNASKEEKVYNLLKIVLDDRREFNAMVKSFVLDPWYMAYTVTGPDKNGSYSVKESKRQLSYKALDKEYRKSAAKGTLYQSADYADKLSAFIKATYSTAAAEGSATDKKSMSIGEAVKRLQAVCDAMLPADLAVTMRRCDAKMLLKTAQSERNMEFSQRSDSTMEGKIFLTFGMAMRGESYNIDVSKSKICSPSDAQ